MEAIEQREAEKSRNHLQAPAKNDDDEDQDLGLERRDAERIAILGTPRMPRQLRRAL
eukprot:CAMPEP_0181338046 /NCGR_PEP_ID=MMETSP1101-20121128/28410_1 /TAXON_ID=46948 /ORGANISM="Rhodomonas abbreviata, Strain Caron Lab Isolate" /LENGTH=56 /DNA_ID=CAMNT_0023448715 /DNA_START=108 /DNA_END=275 /DNA_ORIENTATION=-